MTLEEKHAKALEALNDIQGIISEFVETEPAVDDHSEEIRQRAWELFMMRREPLDALVGQTPESLMAVCRAEAEAIIRQLYQD